MACQAQPRERYKDPGWDCTGEDLTTLMRYHDVPIVVPNRWLSYVMALPEAAAYDDPVPFTGGDHYHLVIEIARPVTYERR